MLVLYTYRGGTTLQTPFLSPTSTPILGIYYNSVTVICAYPALQLCPEACLCTGFTFVADNTGPDWQ